MEDQVEVETIAELKAYENPEDQLRVEVKGYWEPDDGGGGFFTFEAENTQDSAGGMIIASDVTNEGRWIRDMEDDTIDIRWYGARSEIDLYAGDFTQTKKLMLLK